MTDRELCNLRSAYLLDDLDGQRRLVFEDHVCSCGECAGEIESWRAEDAAMRQWQETREHREVSPFTAKSLVRRAAQRERTTSYRKTRPGRLLIAGAAACCAIAALAIFAGGLYGSATAPEPPAVEKLSAPIVIAGQQGGEVFEREDGVVEMRAGNAERLVADLEGDRVVVDKKGRVTALREGSEVRLGLSRGSIAVRAKKRRGAERLVVIVSDLRVEVVGTRFRVSRSPTDDVEVAVSEGIVRLVPASGRAMLVEAGDSVTIGRDKRVTRTALSAARTVEIDDMFVVGSNGSAGAEISDSETKQPPSYGELEGVETPDQKNKPDRKPLSPDSGSVAQRKSGWSPATARKHILAGEYDRAEKMLVLRLRQHGGDLEAWKLLANCRRKARKWRSAVESYGKVVELGSMTQSNRARFVSATILQDRLSQPKQAAAQLEAYLSRPPSATPLKADAMLRLAKALLTTGKAARARVILIDIQDQFPGTAAALNAHQLSAPRGDSPR